MGNNSTFCENSSSVSDQSPTDAPTQLGKPLLQGPWYADNTHPAAGFQMSHCSPASSCLAKSLLLHVLYAFPLRLSLHSQSNSEGCRFLERERKSCNKREPGGAVGQGEWWVGLPATAASWHVLSPYCPGRLPVFGLRYRETSSVQSATWHQ